ncbi:MAG: hypothetical protein FD130_2017 [Halothiobacillaceae bacterium]|nr:MAG: hypothetical protein FD130_2017 [Halothiobacillaceae bacterium]
MIAAKIPLFLTKSLSVAGASSDAKGVSRAEWPCSAMTKMCGAIGGWYNPAGVTPGDGNVMYQESK